MLKRHGRGNDASGVQGTTEGECVVLCPACPRPGVNMSTPTDETKYVGFLVFNYIAEHLPEVMSIVSSWG